MIWVHLEQLLIYGLPPRHLKSLRRWAAMQSGQAIIRLHLNLLIFVTKWDFLLWSKHLTAWRIGKKPKDYNLIFDAWHAEDLKAMVRRDRNHPSVFMWSIGNEVPDQRNPYLSRALNSIVKSEDNTRPVTAGCAMALIREQMASRRLLIFSA